MEAIEILHMCKAPFSYMDCASEDEGAEIQHFRLDINSTFNSDVRHGIGKNIERFQRPVNAVDTLPVAVQATIDRLFVSKECDGVESIFVPRPIAHAERITVDVLSLALRTVILEGGVEFVVVHVSIAVVEKLHAFAAARET